MTLNDIILQSANKGLLQQIQSGAMPSGHNGPYKDPETPVRNTAHWCLIFLKAYEISDEDRFLDASIKCGSYLLSKEARPMDSVFYCRKNPKKDFANGLVGQAWTIEALVALTEITGEKKYRDLAEKVFLMHPYDKNAVAWVRKNVDGSNNGFDKTFNHQLWFAAAGGLLSNNNPVIKEQVISFLNFLDRHLELYSDGCIKHKGKFLLIGKDKKLISFIKKIRMSREKKDYMKMKSVGYHGFNLYAFAMLKNSMPDHSFFRSKKLSRALDYAASDSFKKVLPDSKYGFPYNPSGFEVAYAFETFATLNDNEITKWVEWQLTECFDFEQNLMIKGKTYDEATAAARIYEATRLKNYTLNLEG